MRSKSIEMRPILDTFECQLMEMRPKCVQKTPKMRPKSVHFLDTFECKLIGSGDKLERVQATAKSLIKSIIDDCFSIVQYLTDFYRFLFQMPRKLQFFSQAKRKLLDLLRIILIYGFPRFLGSKWKSKIEKKLCFTL